MSEIDGVIFIRAAQGHTIKTINDSELLTEISDPSEVPICIHGTYKAALPIIMETGLNKMKRNHIHMAVGIPGEDEVITVLQNAGLPHHRRRGHHPEPAREAFPEFPELSDYTIDWSCKQRKRRVS